jgi:hypothetical protein
VDHVEALLQLHGLFQVAQAARASAAFPVIDVGATAGRGKDQRARLVNLFPVRVRGAQADRPGDGFKGSDNDVAANADHQIVLVDGGAGGLKDRPRLGIEDFHAHVLKHLQGRLVNVGDGVV